MSLSDAAAFAVAAWALDEASGTRFDQVGSIDLTDINNVGSNTGKFDTAADFESSSSQVLTVSDTDELSGGNIDFFVRAWIKPESITATHTILTKGSLLSGGAYLLRLTSSNISWVVVDPMGGTITVNGGALSAGNWYLIHAWHDSVNNQIGICVNAGTPVTESFSSSGMWEESANFTMGGLYEAGFGIFNPYDGLLDDVVVLKDYLLSSDERTEDYNSGDGVAFSDWTGGGGGTFTATSSLTIGPQSLSSTGKFSDYTGTSSLTVAAETLSASASHTTPTYTGTSSLTVAAETLSASASHTTPTYTGTSSLTVAAETLSASATHTTPTYTGTSTLTVAAETLVSTGNFFEQTVTGTSNLIIQSIIITSLAYFISLSSKTVGATWIEESRGTEFIEPQRNSEWLEDLREVSWNSRR